MERRAFILFGSNAVAAPMLQIADSEAHTPTIGVLNFENPEPLRGFLREALRTRGYIENANLKVEFRSAEGDRSKLDSLASDLVNLKVDLIVAYSTPAIASAKKTTQNIPIIC